MHQQFYVLVTEPETKGLLLTCSRKTPERYQLPGVSFRSEEEALDPKKGLAASISSRLHVDIELVPGDKLVYGADTVFRGIRKDPKQRAESAAFLPNQDPALLELIMDLVVPNPTMRQMVTDGYLLMESPTKEVETPHAKPSLFFSPDRMELIEFLPRLEKYWTRLMVA